MTDSVADSNRQTNDPEPQRYFGVMVSSTFKDLRPHRDALIKALNGQQLKPVTMEFDSAKPLGDVIDSSLQMVKDSAAYIGVISHKYGQVPESAERNPDKLSLTELEFREARRLRRPMLIFIMGDDHDVKPGDVERDPELVNKLMAFRENAKRPHERSSVHRVYHVFNNIRDFEVAAIHSISELRRILENGRGKGRTAAKTKTREPKRKSEPIPTPPTLYAFPPYIGSHVFVGRTEQLQTLSEWASRADPHPALLYEAIGGVGKSILSWEWTTKYATRVRPDWAGQFWYSFYEKGASMIDFCRRALLYMTGRPSSAFKDKSSRELAADLIQQLRERPWLFILDGLERLLVSYHRFDAAQLHDDHAGAPDVIVSRDPCATISPEDEDLLRAFAVVPPSKILITSRLVPRALLNRSGQPIPGVLQERLPGLRPADAEQLFRSCGVSGDPKHIQDYLKANCDCHPLVIGVLAGLITDYLPSRGNFDEWVVDPAGGGKLNLATLELAQKRNHILSYALLALPENERKLLSTLALLSEAIDSETLYALNPELPILDEVSKPVVPDWPKLSVRERTRVREQYQKHQKRYNAYKKALSQRPHDIEVAAAKLSDTVRDLERRGLLQYDTITKRYDLHPVVRACAAVGLNEDEINQYSQRVIDYFSQRPQNPFTKAKELNDFDNVRHVVRTLFQMGDFRKARDFILTTNFLWVLSAKFDAHNEILTLVKPFFSEGWSVYPRVLQKQGIGLARFAAIALRRINAHQEAFAVSEAALQNVLSKKQKLDIAQLVDLATNAGELNKLALEDRLLQLGGQLAMLELKGRFSYFLARFRQLSIIGDFESARKLWQRMRRVKPPRRTRAIASHHYALHLYFRGILDEETLRDAEEDNRLAESPLGVRNLKALRGSWHAQRGEWEAARASLQEAVALAHRVKKQDRRTEIKLAIANYHLGKLPDARKVLKSFSEDSEEWCQSHLAEFWIALGNSTAARRHAIRAYHWAWADGEPFVRRWELERTRKLLATINVTPPELSPHDPADSPPAVWENALQSAIQHRRRTVRPKPVPQKRGIRIVRNSRDKRYQSGRS